MRAYNCQMGRYAPFHILKRWLIMLYGGNFQGSSGECGEGPTANRECAFMDELHGIQRAIGSLTASVEGIKESLKAQSESLSVVQRDVAKLYTGLSTHMTTEEGNDEAIERRLEGIEEFISRFTAAKNKVIIAIASTAIGSFAAGAGGERVVDIFKSILGS